MIKITSIVPALFTGSMIALAFATPATAKLKGAELTAQAKFTLAAARMTALKARPGKITDQELEQEKGGSGLRYSFDIASQGKTYEVGVDAKTGMVLENIAEGKNPD
jgi:uncharacterized membrane protein YkoI